MTDGEDLPRQARWLPPPSWLLPGSDEPIPQAHRELAEVHADLTAAGVAFAPQWLDTPWWLDPVKVKALGFAGINRYMCADYNTGPGSSLPQKRVTYPELAGMLDAGLDFTWNYEDAAGDFDLGYSTWAARGQHAADYGHNVLKLPYGTGCYASCDMDVGWQMTTTQLESQRGFRDGYQIGPAGIYGSTVAINNTHRAGTSLLGWITLAKSWNHNVPALAGAAHLDQVGSAFMGSADTNNVLLTPHATYLQALGGDVALDAADKAWITTAIHDQSVLGLREQFAPNAEVSNRVKVLVRDNVPSAETIADAVIAAQGSAGPAVLTRQDLIDVLNTTGLKVAE